MALSSYIEIGGLDIVDNNIFVLTNDESEIVRQSMLDIGYDSLGSTQYLNELKRKLYQFFPKRIVDLL